MFMELLFCIIFFVLPLIGMFITILTTKVKEDGGKANQRTFIKKQGHVQYFNYPMPMKTAKKAGGHTHYFFKKEKVCEVPETWALDSS